MCVCVSYHRGNSVTLRQNTNHNNMLTLLVRAAEGWGLGSSQDKIKWKSLAHIW